MTEKRDSIRSKDLFKHKRSLKKEEEVSPQAQIILNLIEKDGEITRGELAAKLEKALTTKQPAERVLSYYKKPLVDAGLITIVVAKPEPKPKAEKAPKAPKAAKPKAAPKAKAAPATQAA